MNLNKKIVSFKFIFEYNKRKFYRHTITHTALAGTDFKIV